MRSQDIAEGVYSVLVVQAEQFFMDKGHFPRLGRLLHNREFLRRIRFLNVDEAHNIATAGISLYSLPPFRPAWGHLTDLRIKLG